MRRFLLSWEGMGSGAHGGPLKAKRTVAPERVQVESIAQMDRAAADRQDTHRENFFPPGCGNFLKGIE